MSNRNFLTQTGSLKPTRGELRHGAGYLDEIFRDDFKRDTRVMVYCCDCRGIEARNKRHVNNSDSVVKFSKTQVNSDGYCTKCGHAAVLLHEEFISKNKQRKSGLTYKKRGKL